MNTTNKHSALLHKSSLVPAQIWIGNHDALMISLISFLQKEFCPHQGCFICATCRQIHDKQYHAIVWITPEKNYTLEQLEPVFEKLSYSLDAHEKVFFILNHIELLSTICANKLLKSIEEPPAGYHFILTTPYKERILPTILSRSVVYDADPSDHNSYQNHILYTLFTTQPCLPTEFLKLTEKQCISEQETIPVLQEIIAYWIDQKKNAPCNKTHQYDLLIAHLNTAYLSPAMPASSTIFWRNLYLQTISLLNTLIAL